MEPLIEIDRSKWLEVRDLYRKNWPKNAVAYCLLDTQISYPNLADTYNFKVYCPYGDINNGIVASMNRAGLEIMIHPLQNIHKTVEALTGTKAIDLNKFFMVPFASPEAESCLKGIKSLGERIKGEIAIKHILSRSSPKFEDLSIPNDTYVSQIKPEHIKFVDEKWTYHNKHTNKLFKALVRNGLSYAIYCKEDEPVAWVVIDTAGALTHLYCVDKHRRKGYAEFVLKYAINDQLSKGKDLLAYTLENNFPAQKLFDKMKFERVEYNKWLVAIPV